jgi:catechol 2,3-dioxygenase-like lactoylglutathione lyase family enzyme
MDIRIFEEAAEARLMLPYTGGQPRSRHAVLALNIQGGGGMEIWQYTSRKPEPAPFEIQAGDLGIFAVKIKARDVEAAFRAQQSLSPGSLLGEPGTDPAQEKHFFVQDPYGNIFQVARHAGIFARSRSATGGVLGCIIGVSDVERSRLFYSGILGYDQVIYDQSGYFEDLALLPGGRGMFRRMLLTHSRPRQGIFSRIFGDTQIELLQPLDRSPRKIFERRMWGDLGFIHLCYDVASMDKLREACEAAGFPFTVDSAKALGKAFDMGEAAGLFSYVEDPDGTLIEFVQTLKLPLVKRFGWYLRTDRLNPAKPLPGWMLKSLTFNRVKD